VSTILTRDLGFGDELADLLNGYSVYVRLSSEHDQWYAEARDYQIVGIGDSRREAVEDMGRTLRAHLRHCRKQGRNALQARQSPGPLPSLNIRLLTFLGAFLPADRRPAMRLRLRAEASRERAPQPT